MVGILLFKFLLKRPNYYDFTEQLMGHEKAQAASVGDNGFLINKGLPSLPHFFASQSTKLVSVWPETTTKESS